MRTQDKSPKMLLIEAKTSQYIEQLLYALYIEKDMTLREIAEFFEDVGVKISIVTLHKWLKEFGIPARRWRVEK